MKRITKIEPSESKQRWIAEYYLVATGRDGQFVFRKFTQEQLQIEFNYMQAEKVTKMLVENGLITSEEFEWIMTENKRTFPTYLAPLL